MTVVCDYDSMYRPGDLGDSMMATSCAATYRSARRDKFTVPSAHKTILKDGYHINKFVKSRGGRNLVSEIPALLRTFDRTDRSNFT